MIWLFAFFISLILAIGCFMYIIIMGPSPYHRDGIVGKMHRIMTSIPLCCCGLCCSIFFGCNQRRGQNSARAWTSHLVQERHWFMVIFYILLVWSVEFLYLFIALPALETTVASKLVSWGLVLLAEGLYAAAVFSDPGKVTPRYELEAQRQFVAKTRASTKAAGRAKDRKGKASSNNTSSSSVVEKQKLRFSFSAEEEYVLNRRYVVDGMIFALMGDADSGCGEFFTASEVKYRTPSSHAEVGIGQVCSTCNVLRPSRSRHCRLCGNCIRRFDHHCPWINNDVAEGTQRYFIGFLFVHAISCTWACWDLCCLIRQFLVSRRAWGWQIISHRGRVPLKFGDYMIIIVHYQMLNFCLLFFAFFIAIVLYAFWAYQMSFAVANITMNEVIKIDDVADFVSGLPELDLVYQEALRVRERLEEVAARKPSALYRLVEPPLPREDPAFNEGGKKNKAYRKKVRSMVIKDLRGLFDNGWVQNLREVFFPYAVITKQRVDEVTKMTRK